MKKITYCLFAGALAVDSVSAWGAPLAAPVRWEQVPDAALNQPGMPAAEPFRWEVGANASYGFSANPSSRFETDVLGIELEGARYITPHQALTLSAGFAAGSHDRDYYVREGRHYFPFEDDYTRSDMYLMAGYRATVTLAHRFALSFGAKGGLDVQSLRTKYGYRAWGYWDDEWDANAKTDTKAGFGYAGYVNLSFEAYPQTFIEVGYQYRGATTQPRARYHGWQEGAPEASKTPDMRWHEVRIGVRRRF